MVRKPRNPEFLKVFQIWSPKSPFNYKQMPFLYLIGLKLEASGYPEKIYSDFRDFRIFGISLGIFRDFKILIPIHGILGFSGFFDLAENEKYRFRIPGIGIWDSKSRKILSWNQLWSLRLVSFKYFLYFRKKKIFIKILKSDDIYN